MVGVLPPVSYLVRLLIMTARLLNTNLFLAARGVYQYGTGAALQNWLKRSGNTLL